MSLLADNRFEYEYEYEYEQEYGGEKRWKASILDPRLSGRYTPWPVTSMPVPEIILASASPRRDHLLREHGFRFRVVPPADVPEVLHGDAPDVLAIRNAARKAANVADRFPDALVIGADTIVVRAGKLYGKPADLEEARAMLGELVGREHRVFTGVGVIRQAGNVRETFCDVTRVWMRPLTPEQIGAYCAAVNVLDKAGAYGIQEQDPASLRPVAPARWTPADGIVERIDGSFSNVMGLPVERLGPVLRKFQISTTN